jgi:HAMP domain-containing protein
MMIDGIAILFRGSAVGRQLSLAARLSLINAVVAILALGGLAANYITQQRHAQITEVAQTLGKAGRLQALVDMNHDGLKGALYRVMHAVAFNKDGIPAAKEDLAEQSKALTERLGQLSKLELPPHILKTVQSAEKPLQDYVKITFKTADLAVGDQLGRANQMLTEFEAAFKALEILQNQIGDTIESETGALTERSQELAVLAKRVSIGVAAAFVMLFAGLFMTVRNQVTKPLTMIAGLIRRISAGEESVRIDNDRRKDEIGMVFEALAGFRDQTEKARRLQTKTDQANEAGQLRQKQVESAVAAFLTAMNQTRASLSAGVDGLLAASKDLSSAAADAEHAIHGQIVGRKHGRRAANRPGHGRDAAVDRGCLATDRHRIEIGIGNGRAGRTVERQCHPIGWHGGADRQRH